jgi:hypothetical protein
MFPPKRRQMTLVGQHFIHVPFCHIPSNTTQRTTFCQLLPHRSSIVIASLLGPVDFSFPSKLWINVACATTKYNIMPPSHVKQMVIEYVERALASIWKLSHLEPFLNV